LLAEKVDDADILVTGNTVIDALQWVSEKITSSNQLKTSIAAQLSSAGLAIELESSKYVLITGHRRENFGDGFKSICKA